MDSVNSDLVAELRKMREGLDQMKSDMSVTKKVNTLLSERLQTIEKQCWANAQYSRVLQSTEYCVLITEYCGQKTNLYTEWVKYFRITCQMVP